MVKTTVHTDLAPKAIGPYAQANRAGDLLFTSGQLGIDAAKGVLAEGVEAQAHSALKNLGEILKAAGSGYDQVVKTTVFVRHMSDFAVVNQVYAQYFTPEYPARSCVEVAALPMGGLVEIECVAICG